MIGARHLAEERLLDCYVSERNGQLPDPPAAEHLADCAECASRYLEFSGFMDGMRLAADEEVDALFPPERLRTQQHDIARRLAIVGRAARVLRFPGRLVSRHMSPDAPRVATRWIAAAAAAGLFVGVAAGLFFETGSGSSRTSGTQTVMTAPANVPPAILPDGPSPLSMMSDDVFFGELEIAVHTPRTRELLALDALTPHVVEISSQAQ